MTKTRSRPEPKTPRQRRGEKGWDVATAAEAADVSAETVLKVEAGSDRIQVRKLLAVASAFGCGDEETFPEFVAGWMRAREAS